MKRGDAYFATVREKFCCPKHFLPTDFKASLTGQRCSLIPGAVLSVFTWTKEVDEKSLLKAERLKSRWKATEVTRAEANTHHNKQQEIEIMDETNDSVVFGPPMLDEWLEEMKKENERLLHELQESKSKDRIYKFYSYVRDNSNSTSLKDKFPYLAG